jgi:hypothetical protein
MQMATKKKRKGKSKTKSKAKRKTTTARKKASARKKTKTVAKKRAKKAPVRRASRKKARAPARPAPAAKPKPKPTRAAKPSAAAAPIAKPPAQPAPGEERIGVVTHYFNHLSVATLRIERGTLRVGDTIHIHGHTTDFTQKVDSLEVDHAPVSEVGPNDDFGLKVIEHAREHDVVYKVQQ